MADSVQKVIEIVFSGDDQLSGTVTGISKGFGQIEDAIQDVLSPLAAVADGVLVADAALLALAAGGLVLAFSKSKDYESAVVDLQKVLGDEEKITEELEARWTSLSRTYGIATVEIINSLAGLRQSGFDVAESMEVLETSLKLSRASELEAEEATNLLKRALIGYNLSAEDAIIVGDLWNKTSNSANTNVSKLAEGFAIVSRQASDAGFSLTETSAALTPIIGVFDSGSEAGIAFSLALTSMLNPTKDGEAAIRALTGVTGPLNDAFATGKDLYEAVAEGIKGVDERTGALYTAQIVGARQAKRIKVAFDDYSETLEKIGPQLEQTGSLQKEVDAQNATTEASLDRLRAGYAELAKEIGNQYREAAKAAVDGGVEIENTLQDLVAAGQFDPLFTVIKDLATDLATLLSGIATALPEAFEGVDFGPLIDAFDDLRGEIGDLFSGLDLTKPEDLAKAIQFVVDSVASLINVSSGMAEVFGRVFTSILSLAEGFNELDEADQKATGNILASAKLIVDAGFAIAAALVIIGEHAETIESIFNVLFGTFKVGFNALQISFDKVILTVVDAAIELNDLLSKVTFGDMSKNFAAQAHSLEELAGGIRTNMRDNAEDLRAGAAQIADGFGIATDAVEEMSEAVKGLPTDAEITIELAARDEELKGIFAEVFGAAATGIEVEVALVPDKVKTENTFKDFNDQIAAANAEGKIAVEVEVEDLDETQIAKIEAQAALISDSLKFSAEIEIADIEAQAKVMEAAFASVSESVSATADATASIFSAFADFTGTVAEKFFLADILTEQVEIQASLANSQVELNSAQAEFIRAKAQALSEGDGLITISADGLEPELEAFMWKIVEKVQIRATESSSEFLLGI